MSHNSSQKSSQSQPSSQQTVSSDPSSQQTLSETSSRNSSQSSQPQVTFQQRTQRPTNNSPRRTNSRQRGFQPRTRGRPITRTYRGYPYSLTVDLPPREDVSSQKQPQLDLPPSREDIFSQQLQLDLPLRETFIPRKNNRNSTFPFVRHSFLAKTTTTNNSYTWNIKGLQAGTYYIRVETDKNITTLKFVKE